MVVLVDNAEHADDSSLGALIGLARALPRQRIVLIVTDRIDTALTLTAEAAGPNWRMPPIGRPRKARTCSANPKSLNPVVMFADFVGRGAYSELIAFNLVPAVLHHAWRAFCSPGVRHVCASAVAWDATAPE